MPLMPIFVHQRRDPLFDAVARLLKRNLVDHDPRAILAERLDLRASPQHDRAPPGVIAAADAAAAADDAAGGKIGAGTDLQQLIDRHVRIVDQLDQALANFAQVVRRNRRSHAHRDAVGPVDQQVGKLRRQHARLGAAIVIGGHEIDRVEIDVVEHQRRDRRQAGFGVSHGGRRQSGDRAEIALLVDQHVPHVPLLGHADQRGIDHAFAVRVIVAAGVAGDLGTLDAAGAGAKIQVVHGHQDAPLRGLEPVAHVGQGAADDDAHGVGQIAVFELFVDRQIDDPPGGEFALHGGLDRGLEIVVVVCSVSAQTAVLSPGVCIPSQSLRQCPARAGHRTPEMASSDALNIPLARRLHNQRSAQRRCRKRLTHNNLRMGDRARRLLRRSLLPRGIFNPQNSPRRASLAACPGPADRPRWHRCRRAPARPRWPTSDRRPERIRQTRRAPFGRCLLRRFQFCRRPSANPDARWRMPCHRDHSPREPVRRESRPAS